MSASLESRKQIVRAAKRRGYIVTSQDGGSGGQWTATLQCPVDGKATVWHLVHVTKAGLLSAIDAMRDRTANWGEDGVP